MLANLERNTAQIGALAPDVQLPSTSLYELLSFIAGELPVWRDRPERRRDRTAETDLTSELCSHLSTAARRGGWDFLTFKLEPPDETVPGRNLDMAATPCGARVLIGERIYYDLNILLPVECKRLPTPSGKRRDPREYVVSDFKTTGGIYRFKAGLHGAGHDLAGMVAYVEQHDCMYWHREITGWIDELGKTSRVWSARDHLKAESADKERGTAIYASTHARPNGLPDIEIRHLWVEM